MALEKVIKENEVILNGVRYPLVDSLKRSLLRPEAQKMVTGDYSLTSNPYMSTWALSDFRGGLGVEEMNEATDAARYWYSTCSTSHQKALTLGRLVTTVTHETPTINYSFDSYTDVGGVWSNEATAYDNNVGTAASANVAATSWSGYLVFNFTSTKTISAIRFYTITTYSADIISRIQIDTSPDNSNWTNRYDSNIDSTWIDADWNTICIGSQIGIKNVRIRMYNSSGNIVGININELQVIETTGTASTPTKFVNFNSQWFLAAGKSLQVLNATGTAFNTVEVFANTITDLIAGPNSYLYIYFGDNANYFYMNGTAPYQFNEADTGEETQDAILGITWDSKLAKIDSAGEIEFCTTPNTSTPDWTAKGTLADNGLDVNDVNNLFVGRNAAGNTIVYAATKKGLYAHDYENGIWLETELKMPDLDTTGLGACTWRDASYISAGLDVMMYQVGQAGSMIGNIGPSRDDGLPEGRGGEIIQLIPSYNYMFALVDSTYEGSTSKSTVLSFNSMGWRQEWEASANNKAMDCGGVSSVVDYRLWWSCGDTIYYVPLQSGITKPKQITNFEYATDGILVTPWFDDNWPIGMKTGQRLYWGADDCTSDEEISIYYRTNRSNTDLATGWTALKTGIDSDGHGSLELGTLYAGLNFYAIQFKIALTRGSTTTLSPILRYLALDYRRNTPHPMWQYEFTVDCTKSHDGKSPEQMIDALLDLPAVNGRMIFYIDDTSTDHRSISTNISGEQTTGQNVRGYYQVTLLEAT